MRKFTHDEAVELLVFVFNVEPDNHDGDCVEAFIAGIRDDEAQKDVESYVSIIPAEIDTDSISIKPDTTDGPSVDCVFIKISVEG